MIFKRGRATAYGTIPSPTHTAASSGDRAEEAGLEPALTITGGTFTLNTGDDAVHSDAYATVTGGTFTIRTGDDGMHADTSLTIVT